MVTIDATCPICGAKHSYGAELMGRYTFCKACGARFYVEVPKLEKRETHATFTGKVDVAIKKETTLDDLLWDTQQGTRYLIDSLRAQESQARTTRGLLVVAIGLLLVNVAGTLWLLMR